MERAWNYLNAGMYKALNNIALNAPNETRRIEGRKKRAPTQKGMTKYNEREDIFLTYKTRLVTNAKLKTAEFDEIAFVCLKSHTKYNNSYFIVPMCIFAIVLECSTMRSHATLIIMRLIKSSELYEDNKRSIPFPSN